MAKAEEICKKETQRNISMQLGSFPRDLLERFMPSSYHFSHTNGEERGEEEEIELSLRQRKELQSLRRMEAKRKRSEKQKNLKAASIGSQGSGSSGISQLESQPPQGYYLFLGIVDVGDSVVQ
ncbi:hypothetical protein V6N11_070126 [Hibiscus sabdariffa]|uniref:Uncharacterized protein n=1 Tax=Hibiscus sabdariffa TaxID=183260 RepID=A0ABR2QE27_9ROSI